MANLIIKSSADNLVLQGSDASPAITVAAAGTTTFAENATLSGTANNLGTVTAGNLSNTAIVYPAGHVVKQSVVNNEISGSIITFSTGDYVDSGLEVAHTTALSSAESYLRVEFHHSMANSTADATYGYLDTTMRTVSNGTYTVGESLSPGSYPSFNGISSGGDNYSTMFLRHHCGLESGMSMPATKTSWAAGDTLYFRFFGKKTGSGNFRFYSNSVYNMTVTEVVR